MKRNFTNKLWRIPAVCLMTLALPFLLSACNEDDPEFLDLSEDAVVVETNRGSLSIKVNSNVEWNVSSDSSAPWCVVSKTKGALSGSFSIVYENNPDTEIRTATITIATAAISKTILISQEGVECTLMLSPESLAFIRPGGRQTVTVVANSEWTVGKPSADWFEVATRTDDSFTIEVGENDFGVQRSGSVAVSSTANGQTFTKTATVIQSATDFYLIATPAEFSLGKNGGEQTVTVLSNLAEWSVTTSLAGNDPWFTVSAASGTGNDTFTFTAVANETGEPRDGVITVSGTDRQDNVLVQSIAVSQSAVPSQIQIDPTNFDIDNESYHLKVNVLTEIPWKVVSSDAWLDLNGLAANHSGNLTFDIIAAANATGNMRTGKVTIMTADPSFSAEMHTVTVVQTPADEKLEIFYDDVTLNPEGETKIVPVDATMDITLTGGAEWLTMVVDDDGNIALTAQHNNTASLREAIVKVSGILQSGNAVNRAFKVTQDAFDFKFEFTQPTFTGIPYNGKTVVAELRTTGEWELDIVKSAIPAWLNVNDISGTGNSNISIVVAGNPSILERHANLIFKSTTMEGVEAVLSLSQDKDPTSPLTDYLYLGRGYDATGDYAYDSYVKNQMLDIEKLIDNNQVSKILAPNKTEEWHIYGKDRTEYQQKINAKANVSGNHGGFTASVTSSFSNQAITTAETQFTTFKHVSQKNIVQLDASLTAAQLRECLTAQALSDIDNMSADALVLRYGTHLITGFVMGGCLDFHMAADTKSSYTETEWSVAVEAGFEYLSSGIKGSAEYNQFNSLKSDSYFSETKLVARGGNSQYTGQTTEGSESLYNEWLTSLNDYTKWVMVDFAGSKLIPISDLATGARKTEIEAAINRHVALNPLPEQVITRKKFSLTSNYIKNTDPVMTGTVTLDLRKMEMRYNSFSSSDREPIDDISSSMITFDASNIVTVNNTSTVRDLSVNEEFKVFIVPEYHAAMYGGAGRDYHLNYMIMYDYNAGKWQYYYVNAAGDAVGGPQQIEPGVPFPLRMYRSGRTDYDYIESWVTVNWN